MNQKTDQNEKKKREQKEYQEYVKTVTPVHNLWLEICMKAFVTGGVICVIGQVILNCCKAAGAG